MAQKIKQQIREGLYVNATNAWSDLEDSVTQRTGNVVLFFFF